MREQDASPRSANAVAFGLAFGYLAAAAVTLASVAFVVAQRDAEAMDRHGTALAEELAHLAVEPMLRRDRIELGVLCNLLAARAEVRRIAIHTVDGAPFVVAGAAAPTNAPTYIRPIAVQDSVAGDARVTLDAGGLGLPLARLLAWTLPFVAIGLVLVVGGFYLIDRPGRPAVAPPSPTDEDRTEPGFVFVATLSRSVPDVLFAQRLGECAYAIARRVSNLYAGRVDALPDAGLAVLLPYSGSPEDRCFEAISVALLVRRLLGEADPIAPAGAAAPATPDRLFRYAVDHLPNGFALRDGKVRPSSVAPALLLTSLGGAGRIVIGAAAHAELLQPERVVVDELNNPATEALSAGVDRPHGVVSALADEYESVLSRQMAVIAEPGQGVIQPQGRRRAGSPEAATGPDVPARPDSACRSLNRNRVWRAPA